MALTQKTSSLNDAMISVVIPVYRAGGVLRELYSNLADVMGQQGRQFEVIFVEDCGGDDSWSVIESLATAHANVRGIQLNRNYGQHNALLCGIRAAQGAVIITMDDDLQHPPEVLPALIERFEEGFDVVYGAPESQPHGLFRGMASQVSKWVLNKAMGAETAENISALRIFKTRLREAFADYRSPFVNIDVMLTWATTNFSMVRVRHDARAKGASGYTVRMLVRHALNMMTGFSNLPLQVASVSGFVFAAFGMSVLAYVLLMYFIVGSAVPGFAFLASIVALFSGVQLLAIGIIGEYLARIHFRTMDRPAYVVRQESDRPA